MLSAADERHEKVKGFRRERHRLTVPQQEPFRRVEVKGTDHERRDVLRIVLIDVPQVVVALHGRAILLLSRPAMRILSSLELEAAVAHEIAHDYFWPEWERMSASGDDDRLGRKTLELKCDGVAGLILIALGRDVAQLHKAIRKIETFNEKVGATAEAERYPTPRERRAFTDALLAGRR